MVDVEDKRGEYSYLGIAYIIGGRWLSELGNGERRRILPPRREWFSKKTGPSVGIGGCHE